LDLLGRDPRLLSAGHVQRRARARAGALDVGHPGDAVAAAQELQRVDAEHQADDADDDKRADAQAAAAERNRDAAAAREHAAATLAAAILDVLAFPVAFAVSHGVVLDVAELVAPCAAGAVSGR